jgi:hypothetical protein
MKGKIDACGNLWIERAGRWVAIRCPVQPTRLVSSDAQANCYWPSYKYEAVCCNHACRLWIEPWKSESLNGRTTMSCGAGRDPDSTGCWQDAFTELTDERVAP